MDETDAIKEPLSPVEDQQKNIPAEQKPSYFEKIRAGLIGQRRSRRTFAKHR